MATRQEQIEFVKKIYPAAKRLREKSADTLHPLFVTAQAALETGWRVRGIDNNIFGITVGSSWTGKKKLVQTAEVFSTPNKTFKAPEEVLSVLALGEGRYRCVVKRFFRVYDSLEDCLADHSALLKKPVYADAWAYRDSPKEYARRIVDAEGARYATAPDYARIMAGVIDRVEGIVIELRL